MTDRPAIDPAPGRGCYDRGLSRQARQTEQQERLVAWIAETHLHRGAALTVQDVVKAAGVGRNTFYEYFDGLEHALDFAAQARAKLIRENLEGDMATARTLIGKLRALSKRWFREATLDPASLALLLRSPRPGALSDGATLFATLINMALEQSALQGARHPGTSLVSCAALAAEGAAAYLMRGGTSADELEDALSTVLTQVFR